MRDVRQDLVKVLELLLASLVLNNSSVFSQTTKIEGLANRRYDNERCSRRAWWQLPVDSIKATPGRLQYYTQQKLRSYILWVLEVAEEENMYGPEAIGRSRIWPPTVVDDRKNLSANDIYTPHYSAGAQQVWCIRLYKYIGVR